MAKKKSGRNAKGTGQKNPPWKSKLAQITQIVNSYRPPKVGASYVKETLPNLVKQVTYQQKPLADLIKAQEVIDAKRHAPREGGNRAAAGAVFAKWLKDKAPDSKLGDKFHFKWEGLKEGSGIVAAKDLKRHELFIQIPRKAMITSTQASQSPLGKVLMKDPMFGSMPNLMLAVYIMFERLNPESTWAPYLNALPRQFNLPLFFNAEELKQLAGSPTYYDALKIQKQTLRQYVLTTKLLSGAGGGGGREAAGLKLPPFSYRDFRWAVSVVMTRQNQIPSASDPKKRLMVLIPGWDFCNFRDGELTTQFNDEVDSSESFTMEDVKEGSQVYIHYGNRPNSKLFLFSGFIADDNKSDYVEVIFAYPAEAAEDNYKVDLKPEDAPMAKIRRMMLQVRQLREIIQPFRIYPDGKPSDACLTWCRICVCNKTEAAEVLKAKTPNIKSLGRRNEQAAHALLKENVERSLKKYPTTVDQDRKLLDTTRLSPNSRIAVRLRLAEKIVLQKCVKYATSVVEGGIGEAGSAAGDKKAS